MNKFKGIIDYLKLFLILILFFVIYDGIIYNLYHNLYIKGTKSVFLIELPIVITLTTIFYFQKINNIFFKYITPIISIMSLYIFFDTFHNFLLRVPRISDFENIFAVYHFIPTLFVSGILFLIVTISILTAALIKNKKYALGIFSIGVFFLMGITIISSPIFRSSNYYDL